MTKEQATELLKDCILTLKNRGKEFKTNPELIKVWGEQQKKVSEAFSKLSQEDLLWAEENYEKWFEEVIKPTIGDKNEMR